MTVWRILVVEMLRVTELVVHIVSVARMAVVGRNESGMAWRGVAWCCRRGSHWRTGSGLYGGSGGGVLASSFVVAVS
jgi:hypothetical protein